MHSAETSRKTRRIRRGFSGLWVGQRWAFLGAKGRDEASRRTSDLGLKRLEGSRETSSDWSFSQLVVMEWDG